MFSTARQVAAQYREIYEALVFVGFSEEQAMRILLGMMGGILGQG